MISPVSSSTRTPRQSKAREAVTMSCVRGAGGALTFTLPEPPSANRWWRKWRGRMVLSEEARRYKTLVRFTHRRQEIRGNVAVSITWFRGRKAGDLDKRIPIVLDALQGVAYATDAQITHITAARFDDPNKPRVIVTVASFSEG